MRDNFNFNWIFITSLILSLAYSCKKEVPKVIPTLTTTAVSIITSTTATGGGLITSDGNATVTTRGVCWSLSQSPTTSDNKTSDGTGIGSFASSITGLSPSTTYYLRAFATNSIGTAYGNQIIIATESQVRYYKGNTHSHSTKSDGSLDPIKLADSFRKAGYQFLFITDHNYVTSVNQLSSPDFIVFSGEEFTYNRHFNGLGIQNDFQYESDKQIINSVLNQGGIPILNHPFYPPTRIYSKEILALDKLKFIEIHNSICESYGYHDNQMLWDSLLTSGKLIFGIASDDTHGSDMIGKGWIMVKARELQRDALIEGINEGRFYSSTGVVFTHIGLTSSIIDIETSNATQIKFIGEGGKLLKIVEGSIGTYFLSGLEMYVRVEALNKNLGHQAWTQPLIWKNKSIFFDM